MQFFLFLPKLVEQYYKARENFWITCAVLVGLSHFICLIVIYHNDLRASYFTYNDAYWTVFYEKPYARILGYLVGVASGCTYYTFKYEKNNGVIRPEYDDEDEDPAD